MGLRHPILAIFHFLILTSVFCFTRTRTTSTIPIDKLPNLVLVLLLVLDNRLLSYLSYNLNHHQCHIILRNNVLAETVQRINYGGNHLLCTFGGILTDNFK